MATEGPDFICVGMPKAGTSWLYDQTVDHPDFWMPPVKEIRYLDNPITKTARAANRLGREYKRGGAEGERRKRDERDQAFLERAIALDGKPMDIHAYADLFNVKGNSLTGDVTPAYAALEESVIAQVAEHLPQVKVVLLIRDPVSRTWSHFCMKHRGGKFDDRYLTNPVKFKKLLEKSRNIEERSVPTKIVERWKRAAPNVAFRHFFFDDLAQRPDWFRREVLTFIGGDPDKQSGGLEAGYNRKSQNAKVELSPEIEAIIVEHLRPELRACAREFGEHASEWADKYNVFPKRKSNPFARRRKRKRDAVLEPS
jgi:Sulfotransferase family